MRACLFLILGVTASAWAFDSTSAPTPSSAAESSKPLPSAAPSVPSIAETKSLTFIGKQFDLKFHPAQQVVPLYEYYSGQDTPEQWMELVDFRIYPARPDGNAPIDHAKRTAADFKNKYPYMNFALYEDKKGGIALLDFFYPESTHKEPGKSFVEFNAFRFFVDPSSGRTISFHYAKNIEGAGASRQMPDVIADIKRTRAEVIPAMAALPIYQQ